MKPKMSKELLHSLESEKKRNQRRGWVLALTLILFSAFAPSDSPHSYLIALMLVVLIGVVNLHEEDTEKTIQLLYKERD